MTPQILLPELKKGQMLAIILAYDLQTATQRFTSLPGNDHVEASSSAMSLQLPVAGHELPTRALPGQ
jgi:hypothetical protein